jgi:hypothetical protein
MTRTVCILIALASLGVSASAQERFRITGLSTAKAAHFETAEGNVDATRGAEIPQGALHVAAGQQLMAVSGAGVVCILNGPASAMFLPDERMIDLAAGRLMLDLGAQAGLGLRTPEENGARALEVAAGPGRVYAARSADRVDVAFVGPGELSVLAVGEELSLGSGQGITLQGGQKTELAAGWASEQFPETLADELSVGAARARRVVVGDLLFRNIIKWDQRAGAQYVVKRVEASSFEPEIRQTAATLSQAPPPTVAARAIPPTVVSVAANEVPPLSPAALTVQNVAAGVTAVTLNAQARNLLRTTGSIGLGFGGLGQLAIPGFFGGIRTIGPAGLGALR